MDLACLPMRLNSKFTKTPTDQYDFLKGMTTIQSILAQIKLRLGDLWWYTLILFVVQRFGDVINAGIGLWLIPKYVPQEELGALLPLTQIGTALALPISVFAVTFLKYVNIFEARGEHGKVKSLIRDVFWLVAILFVAVMIYARFFMPAVFERMRVADGRLGLFVVAYGMLGVVSTFFSSALQALKKFRHISIIGLVGAPLRLVTLLICLPIRALSGYFVGHIVVALYGIAVSIFGLRSLLFSKRIPSVPYLRSDGMKMVRFTIPIMMGSLALMPMGVIETFVIRHRLPEVESAAYYMISRFAEIGSYVGMSMVFILFPLASEQHERGNQSQRLVIHSIAGALASGLVLAGIYWLFGRYLLQMLPAGASYVSYVPHMALLTVIIAMRTAGNCFVAYELACNRYGFYWWLGGISILESAFLYGITGFSFFAPWVPASWLEWVTEFNPARIEFVLGVMFGYSLIWILFMVPHIMIQRKARDIGIFSDNITERHLKGDVA